MNRRPQSSILRLPRNYNFISRLPENFEIQILRKGNETPDGVWYHGVVMGHDLNILSRVELNQGQSYLIRKKDSLTLELVDKKPVRQSDSVKKDIDYLG